MGISQSWHTYWVYCQELSFVLKSIILAVASPSERKEINSWSFMALYDQNQSFLEVISAIRCCQSVNSTPCMLLDEVNWKKTSNKMMKKFQQAQVLFSSYCYIMINAETQQYQIFSDAKRIKTTELLPFRWERWAKDKCCISICIIGYHMLKSCWVFS